MKFLMKVWKCLDEARGITERTKYYGSEYMTVYNFCRNRSINYCELRVFKKIAKIWNVPISALVNLINYEGIGEQDERNR